MLQILFGIYLVVFGSWRVYQNYAARAWATADGRVEGSSVGGTTRRGYHAKLRYRYEVGGRTFYGQDYKPSCNRVFFWTSAQAIVNALPVGETVRVHYNPAKPEVAAIKVGVEPGDTVMPIFGSIWLLFCFWPPDKRDKKAADASSSA
jgi:hypothetical protein